MKKRLHDTLALAEKISAQRLAGECSPQAQAAQLRDLLEQIRFFQHERLAHLLVMLTVALLCVGTTLFLTVHPSRPILALDTLFFVLLVPYIAHYFTLENGVQALYRVYDRWAEVPKD